MTKKNLAPQDEKELRKKLMEKSWNLYVALCCSIAGGFIASIFTSIILGYSPIPQFKTFGWPIILLGLSFILIFFGMLILFWLVHAQSKRNHKRGQMVRGQTT